MNSLVIVTLPYRVSQALHSSVNTDRRYDIVFMFTLSHMYVSVCVCGV